MCSPSSAPLITSHTYTSEDADDHFALEADTKVLSVFLTSYYFSISFVSDVTAGKVIESLSSGAWEYIVVSIEWRMRNHGHHHDDCAK